MQKKKKSVLTEAQKLEVALNLNSKRLRVKKLNIKKTNPRRVKVSRKIKQRTNVRMNPQTVKKETLKVISPRDKSKETPKNPKRF
jgi:hypothetical protein